MLENKNKVILIIRDGWGHRTNHNLNAIFSGRPSFTQTLMEKYPTTLLKASGEAVGLPKGYQGNSEVGHMTIGSGRITDQSLQRINKTIKNKSFYKNKSFIKAIENCKQNNTSLHLMGLLQTEGVHSHIDHLYALLAICKQEEFKNVFIHIFTDGRDSPVTAAKEKIMHLQNHLNSLGFGQIVSITGRYYAMDRNNVWERTKIAYDAIVKAKSDEQFSNPIASISSAYKKEETDEFIKPKIHKDYKGIKDNDSIIFYNFRTDRTRQLTKSIVEPDFDKWQRESLNTFFVTMTQFYSPMNATIAFDDAKNKNILGEIISKNNLQQLRISETEKYAHVTFFFNDQNETPYKGEKRILIKSPNVATYDMQPEMSIKEITSKICEQIKQQTNDLIIVNLVNGDMVGHTGITSAIEKAIKAVDKALEQSVPIALENDYSLIIFADHGNAEDQTQQWRTSHTTNPVPCILVSNTIKNVKLRNGMGLQDIAPTVLDILDIEKPIEMSGNSIIDKTN